MRSNIPTQTILIERETLKRNPLKSRLTVVLVTALAGFALWAPTAAQATGANNNAAYLVTWNNNIENFTPPSCSPAGGSFDWNNLVNYISKQTYAPDVFTVQQVSGQTQLTEILTLLNKKFAQTYGGVIAKANPEPGGYTSACGKLKNQQTNAIIYRTSRLTLIQKRTWRSDGLINGSCANLEIPGQDRVINVGAIFKDAVNKRQVAVASFHWPVQNIDTNVPGIGNSGECAKENFKEANDAVDTLATDNKISTTTLRIVAGDANAKTNRKDWWNHAVKTAGYRDPIAEVCGQTDGSQKCTGHNTINVDVPSSADAEARRIDYILAEHSGGFVSGQSRTLSSATVGGQYSQHLAQVAFIKYG